VQLIDIRDHAKNGVALDKFREARFPLVAQAKPRMTDVNAVKDEGQTYD
jgi:hypothetical protein